MEEQEGLAQAKKEIETALTKLLMAETNLFQDGVIGLNWKEKEQKLQRMQQLLKQLIFKSINLLLFIDQKNLALYEQLSTLGESPKSDKCSEEKEEAKKEVCKETDVNLEEKPNEIGTNQADEGLATVLERADGDTNEETNKELTDQETMQEPDLSLPTETVEDDVDSTTESKIEEIDETPVLEDNDAVVEIPILGEDEVDEETNILENVSEKETANEESDIEPDKTVLRDMDEIKEHELKQADEMELKESSPISEEEEKTFLSEANEEMEDFSLLEPKGELESGPVVEVKTEPSPVFDNDEHSDTSPILESQESTEIEIEPTETEVIPEISPDLDSQENTETTPILETEEKSEDSRILDAQKKNGNDPCSEN